MIRALAVAVASMVAAAALSVYGVTPTYAAPAAPTDDPILGFTQFLPPPQVVTPIGLGIGGTAAVTTAAAVGSGTSAAACTTATLGTCALLGGAFLGSFYLTTKALEWAFPPFEMPDPLLLMDAVTVQDTKLCTDVGGPLAAAAAAVVPGSRCIFILRNAVLTSDTTGTVQNSFFTPKAHPDMLYKGDVTPGTTACFAATLGTCSVHYINYSTGALATAGNGNPSWDFNSQPHVGGYAMSDYIVYRIPPAPATAPCYGEITCGISPRTTIDWRPGTPTPALIQPMDRRVHQYGMQRRTVATVRCTHASTITSETKIEYSAWWYDSELADGKFPIKMPSCGPNVNIVPTRIEINIETIGTTVKPTIFIADYPTTEAVDLQTVQKCLQNNPTDNTPCYPDLNPAGTLCTIGGIDVALKYCTAQTDGETRFGTDTQVLVQPSPSNTPRPAGTTFTPPDPDHNPTTGTTPADPEDPEDPDPGTSPTEVITDTPNNPDDDASSSDCMPNGWGLFNPVDWILKPVKCALKWAFVPETALSTRLQTVQVEVDESAVGTITDTATSFQSTASGGMAGASTSTCQGPPMKFRNGGDPSYPLSSCDGMMATLANVFRDLASLALVLLGLILLFNSIGRPFGIEPIRFGSSGDES